MTEPSIKTAVVTGHHPFDLPALTDLFRALPGIEGYVQSLDDFVVDQAEARDWYDAVVFYNFHQETPGPPDDEPWWRRGTRAALERLGKSPQGIVILHHGLLAYREWSLWSDIVGIEHRGSGYHPNEQVLVHIEDPEHPITAGLHDFETVDETYTVDEPKPENHILLTTDHPRSMHALAWTRLYKQARVFCYESGHDAQAYQNPNFQEVLARGLAWVSRCI